MVDVPGPRRHTTFRQGPTLVVATLGVLVGLFGMHVLGLHGVQHDAHAVAGTESHDHTAHEHQPPAAEPATATTTVEECCDHGHAMGPLMLCLALLVASGIALFVGGRRDTRSIRAVRTPGPVRRPPTPSARAGPPASTAFSVIRC